MVWKKAKIVASCSSVFLVQALQLGLIGCREKKNDITHFDYIRIEMFLIFKRGILRLNKPKFSIRK